MKQEPESSESGFIVDLAVRVRAFDTCHEYAAEHHPIKRDRRDHSSIVHVQWLHGLRTLSRSDSRNGTRFRSSRSVSSTNQLSIGTPLESCRERRRTIKKSLTKQSV